MKTLLSILMTLAITSPTLASQKRFNSQTRTQTSQRLYKETTGRCYFKETVLKTRVGWKSTTEIAQMSPRQRDFALMSKAPAAYRKVYTSSCRG